MCSSSPNIPNLAQDIISYEQYILHGCNVQRVVIRQNLKRKPLSVTAKFNVVSLNVSSLRLVTGMTTFLYENTEAF